MPKRKQTRAGKKKYANIAAAKEIQSRVGGVKSTKRSIQAVNKEIRKARRPIYAFNKKIREAPSKYFKSKYKKQLSEYVKNNSENISNLVLRRSDLRSLDREFSLLKKERIKLRKEISELKEKVKKAKRKNNTKEVASLALKEASARMKINSIDEATGKRKMIKAPEVSENDLQNREKGFTFFAQYAYWEGVRAFEDDVKQAAFDYIILDGNKYNLKSEKIDISSIGKVYFAGINADSETSIYKYINYSKSTIKYTIDYDIDIN